jgi:hypothetical protein
MQVLKKSFPFNHSDFTGDVNLTISCTFKMFSEKFIKLKSYADAQLSNYFPSVRGAVLLIVIPAVFIVPIYFFSILSEIVTGKTHRPVLEYETRLAAIKKDLPAFISPFLIGSSIIVILFPTSRLRGVWLVLTISLGAGVGLGITSSMIFLWLAFIGPPDSYYFAAELTLAVFRMQDSRGFRIKL